jgi:inhibitor of cysteine peptidase
MMRNFTICIITAGLICNLFEIGICAGTKPKENMDDKRKSGLISLTIADSSRTLRVGIGDTLDLELKSIPGTGYRWQIDSIDTAMLIPTKLPRPLAPEKPYKVGGPVPYYFAFMAAAPGRTTLRLAYSRPWEKDVPPAKTFEIKVVIESKD